MTEPDTWFLLVQFKNLGRTSVTTYTDAAEAASAYSDAECRYKDRLGRPHGPVDVLLVGASSLDVVKDRYPSYFTTGRSRAERISALLDNLPVVFAH